MAYERVPISFSCTSGPTPHDVDADGIGHGDTKDAALAAARQDADIKLKTGLICDGDCVIKVSTVEPAFDEARPTYSPFGSGWECKVTRAKSVEVTCAKKTEQAAGGTVVFTTDELRYIWALAKGRAAPDQMRYGPTEGTEEPPAAEGLAGRPLCWCGDYIDMELPEDDGSSTTFCDPAWRGCPQWLTWGGHLWVLRQGSCRRQPCTGVGPIAPATPGVAKA